ncbi:GntR family transcriptional regulator [Prauserella cavernicola]|uniref:GntR family transcriptional regulator n=1 Tax=Prauserella cavernicola TaxID=2800127 RepID=A0A934QPI3_9PSEU|nr:GntR family transcriptional regulator [Prauserella cavernicola]MBK1783364.1 GntR family transcriptional regulator [Prauserella cavernicola]
MDAQPPTTSRPPQSKADYVYGVLLDDIRSSRIPGGSPLRAAAVAERLGVSITPVREALRRLEKDRLINYERHHGATVVDLSDAALVEYYHVRAVLEGLGAKLAAARITAEELDRLRALHASMVGNADAGRNELLGEQSQELHLAITDIGGPAYLGAHARSVRESFPVPRTASLWLNDEHVRGHLRAHEELLAALAAGDGDTAERIMIDHVRLSAGFRLGIGDE